VPRFFENPAFILSRRAVAALIVIGSIPVIWPIGTKYEGAILPVVENVRVDFDHATEIEVEQADGSRALTPSIVVRDRLDKVRACDFKAVFWFNEDRRRVPAIFLDDNGDEPATRPVEDNQDAGPWLLVGLASEEELAKSIAFVQSRCHPLWKTFTPFYP